MVDPLIHPFTAPHHNAIQATAPAAAPSHDTAAGAAGATQPLLLPQQQQAAAGGELVMAALRRTYEDEGFRALFRGASGLAFYVCRWE